MIGHSPHLHLLLVQDLGQDQEGAVDPAASPFSLEQEAASEHLVFPHHEAMQEAQLHPHSQCHHQLEPRHHHQLGPRHHHHQDSLSDVPLVFICFQVHQLLIVTQMVLVISKSMTICFKEMGSIQLF